MAKKNEISDAVSLYELKAQSQIMEPPIEVMLERFGYGKDIGVNDVRMAAVPVKTATEFLGVYEASKVSRSSKWEDYQEFLQDRRVAISRAAIEADKEAEVQRQTAQVVDVEAPTFEEWEAQNGDA